MKKRKFELVTEYKPSGDQPEAISKLTDGINKGIKEQTLLGVTGSGKTFTMANVIANVNKPTLVLRTTKYLRRSSAQSSRNFFRTTPLNILFHTTIIISLKPIYREPILILKKIPQ